MQKKPRKNSAKKNQKRRDFYSVFEFFRYSLKQSAGLAVVFLIFGIIFFSQAQNTEVKTVSLQPGSCSGWINADQTKKLDLMENTRPEWFNDQNSAKISGLNSDLESSTDLNLVCKGFVLPVGVAEDSTLRNARVVVSLAAQTQAGSEEILVIETSLDGENWTKQDSFMLNREVSNAAHGGYWIFDFPLLNADNLNGLQARFRFVTWPAAAHSTVWVDGVQVLAETRPKPTVEPLFLPKDAIKINKKDFKFGENPVVKVEVERASPLRFLGLKGTQRQVEEVRLEDPDGEALPLEYDLTGSAEGRSVFSNYTFKTEKFTKPGKYTATFTILQDGKLSEIKNEFFWGVLVMNMNRSVYRPGQTVYFGMATLDPQGHTICDAELVLKITDPFGAVKILKTEDGGITRSNECGPITVTDVPDYSAEYDTADEGEYQAELTAVTTSGVHFISETIYVDAVIPFDISRSGPTRIYPLADYTMAVTVKAQDDFVGLVEETLPGSFEVLIVSNNGQVKKEGKVLKIKWQVKWRANQIYTLSYRFNPPDISPELFLLGPVKIGNYLESRQWQIASDIVGLAALETSANTSVFRHEGEGRHLVFTDDLTGYAFYVNSSGTLVYKKTVNGGIDWADAINVTDQTDCENFAIWYDRWTPGSTGNLIHVAFLENGTDTIYYDNIDTSSSDTQKGEVAAYSDSATGRTGSTDSISIVSATDGDIYIAISSGAANSTAVVRNSSDTGTNWSTTADEGLDDVTQDYVLLMPLASADILLLRWDVSADDIQSKEYEDSANSWEANWTDHNVDTNAVEGASRSETWGATIDPYTYNIYLAYVDNAWDASATPDVRTAVYNGSAWTSKTNVITDTNTITSATIAFDTFTSEIYVIYIRGSTGASTVYYKVSDDGMTTWSAERGPVMNLNTTQVDTVHANTVSDKMLGMWAIDGSNFDIWYGTVFDVGLLSGALQLTNMNGFETADSVDANSTSGTPTYSNSIYRSGEYSLRSNPSSSAMWVQHGVTYNANGSEGSTGYDVLSSVFALRVASGTTQNQATIIYDVRRAADSQFTITLNTDRTISITGGAAASTTALAQDTWYVLAITINADTDTHEVGIYNSDMTVFYESLTSASALGGTSFTYVRLGASTASTTADIYIDDFMVYVNNTTGNFPLLKGDYRIARMDADSAGTNTAWVGAGTCTGCTADYQYINEIPTSTANYIQITADGDETSNLESASSAGITGTFMQARVMNTVWESSNTNQTVVHTIRVLSGLTNETSSINTTTTVTDFMKMYNFVDLRPAIVGESTTPYTVTNLDSLQIGVGTDQDPGSGYYRSGSNTVQVAYQPSKISVSGKIYSDDGSTAYDCSANNLTIYASTNGGSDRTGICISSAGVYSVISDPTSSAGDPIAVYIDSSETPKATTVTLANDTTSNISGFDLYQDRVILRHETSSATPMTNAKLATADNGNGGIRYGVSSSNLTTDSGLELHVWTGKTYDPGGTVTTNSSGGNFHIDDSATAYLDTDSNSIGQDILVDGAASLTIDGSTTVGSDIITSGTSATITHAANSPIITLSNTNVIGGGTTPSLTFYNLTISGSSTFNSDFTVKNNLTLPASVTANSTTVTMTGTSSTLTGGGATINNLTIDPASAGTITLSTSDLNVSGTVSIASGDTFSMGSGRTLTHSGSTLTLTGTLSGPGRFTYRSSTAFPSGGTLSGSLVLRFDATSNNQTMTNRTDYFTVEVDNSGSTDGRVVTMSASTHTLGGNLTILSSGTGSINLSGDTNDPTVNITGNLSYTSGGGTKTITTGTGTWTVSGDVNMTNGVFTPDTNHTLVLNGSGKSLTSAGNTPFNITVDPGTGNTFTFNDAVTTKFVNPVSGDLTISSGTLASASDITVNGGDFTGAGALNHTGGTVTIYTSGTVGSSSGQAWNFNNLTFSIGFSGCTLDYTSTVHASAGTMTVNGVFATQSCSSGESTYRHYLDAGASTWILAGAQAGTVIYLLDNGDTSTFRYTSSSNSNILGNTTGYYNLEMIPASGTPTYTLYTSYVYGNLTINSSVTLSHGTNELRMRGTGKTIDAGGATFYDFYLDNSNTVTVSNTGFTASRVLSIGGSAVLSISSGQTVSHTGTIFILTGTISGAGTLRFTNTSAGPGTGGTLSSVVRYDASANNISSTIIDARTYGGKVEIYASDSATADRTVTLSASTYTLSGATSHLHVINDSNTYTLTLVGTNNPTVNIGGDLDFTGVGSSSEIITSGTGTWTVSGNVNFTDGTYTATSGNTLIMNGTGTLTSAAQTLQNLTLSGTVTLANETHTVSGDFSMAGGTITPGSSLVLMNGTANTITGGGQTLYDLTINPAPTGTITLQTSDLTVSNTLVIAILDTLAIDNGRTLTHSGATLTLNGILNGPGRLTYRSGTAFPTSGVLASSLILRFDTVANDQTMSARTDYQFVEIDNSGTTAGRTVTAGSAGGQTIIIASTLDLLNTGADPSTTIFQADTYDPTLTVTGNVTIAANATFQASSATTMNFGSGFSNSGTFNHNSGTVALTTSAASTISGSTTFNNLSVTGIGAAKAITFTAGTTQTVIGTWTVTGASGQLVTLQSSSSPTQWNINPASASISYVQISDSYNTSGSTICATYSTDTGNNNTGWTVSGTGSCGSTLTVVLSGNAAALGTLSVSNINQAGITSTVTTNATYGYISMVKYNNTLTSGTNIIPDTTGGTIVAGTSEFGASSSDSGNTIAQWNPAACSTTATTSNATALSTNFQSFASATSAVTNESTTLCFLASISGLTPAGYYTSTVSLVTTAKF
ncbi:hypothetical protein C4546_02060 [Candidatus Parcubacteria bacterium]|jgi:hypothetical protein|nr:MAG: hypothetical protein C4546_02060 [Candidatus Parcubacteria bacterium]